MSRIYFNQIAPQWDAIGIEKDQEKLRSLLNRLDIQPGSTVLDAGTGTGILLPWLLNKVGEQGKIAALDYAEEMLDVARAKQLSGLIDYICADITSVPRPDDYFDSVICYSCFPHFQDKPAALEEIHRLLKSGGTLYIGHTASRSKINSIHSRIADMANDLIPDNETMHQLLSSAGFKDIIIQDNDDDYLAIANKL